MEERKIVRRPGRRLGAERRCIARKILRRFYATDDFAYLPSEVRLAMLELCPEQELDDRSAAKTAQPEPACENRDIALRLVSSWG